MVLLPVRHPADVPLVEKTRARGTARVKFDTKIVQSHQTSDDCRYLQDRHRNRPPQKTPAVNQDSKCSLNRDSKLRKIEVVGVLNLRDLRTRNRRGHRLVLDKSIVSRDGMTRQNEVTVIVCQFSANFGRCPG